MSSFRGLKSTVRRLTPKSIMSIYQFIRTIYLRELLYRHLRRSYSYDRARFEAHSAVVRRDWSQDNLAALVTMDYHRIEKGMTLKDPKLGYASRWISSQFIKNLNRYIASKGDGDELALTALNVLRAYRDFHIKNNYPMPKIFAEIDELENRFRGRHCPNGGVKLTTRDQILGHGMKEFAQFLRSRHSIRHFSSEPVSPDLIVEAVSLAQSTPSVCNRQGWKVYAINTPAAIARALAVQNGNDGFGHQLNTVLVVTCDLTRLLTIGERNQGWIDGGMFCMTLVLALHSRGLGTCCLNLSLDHEQDIELRKAVPIALHESPVMMIAVGHLPETLSVAQSARRPLAEVLTWVTDTT